MWCTLVALCLVAAGAQPRHVQRAPGSTPTLRVAAPGAAAAVRRPASSHVGPFVVPDAVAAPVAARLLVAYEMPAAYQAPASQLCSPRSSRGPPSV